jgi:hypothetical protein
VSQEVLQEILARALEDERFRHRLLDDPHRALHGYDLSTEEREALIAGNLRDLLLTVGRAGGDPKDPAAGSGSQGGR